MKEFFKYVLAGFFAISVAAWAVLPIVIIGAVAWLVWIF